MPVERYPNLDVPGLRADIERAFRERARGNLALDEENLDKGLAIIKDDLRRFLDSASVKLDRTFGVV